MKRLQEYIELAIAKNLLLLPFCFCAWFSAHSQPHSKCDNGIELIGGITQYGYTINPGFIRYVSNRLYFKVNPFYSRELDRNLYHYLYGIDISGAYTAVRLPHNWFINGVVGFGASYEYGRFKEQTQHQFQDTKYSATFGVEIEKYFNQNWSAVCFANQHLVTNTNSSWGYHRWYILLGVRWHFYRLNRCNPTSTYIKS